VDGDAKLEGEARRNRRKVLINGDQYAILGFKEHVFTFRSPLALLRSAARAGQIRSADLSPVIGRWKSWLDRFNHRKATHSVP